ncbi:hypothetical protein [Oceanobacillus bengalensis]|uniref:Uncharacterized protein n=1 Tax=Oceanobacillus bengalensis TaxID=1435466 RepID=A0A494YW19_9BACI|nr:hypothetical protein [Oceanobacillus bengalensis]RKQ14415.1 hypothetical protein D8M05_13395 [Oceanobacillus bengalensis]
MSDEIANQILAELKVISGKVNNIEKEQNSLKDDVNSLKSDVKVLKDDVKNLDSEQKQIKLAVVENNKILKRIELNQASQQQVIDLLSPRSIQQEADIKQLQV